MAAKTIFVLCASALLVQAISGQCIGYNSAPAISLASSGCGCGNGLGAYGLNSAVANSNGGPLNVASSSPLAPSGISVLSENNIQGQLAVEGQLPFLAAVALQGEVPSSGAGGVSYSCGSNNVGIVSQGQASGLGYGAGLGYGSGLGYGAGIGSSLGAGSLAGLGGLAIGGISSGCGCGV